MARNLLKQQASASLLSYRNKKSWTENVPVFRPTFYFRDLLDCPFLYVQEMTKMSVSCGRYTASSLPLRSAANMTVRSLSSANE